MMYEEVIRDFAERTRKNLAVIEKLALENSGVFETTQLVNSCLGLLVFPQQEFMDRIPEMPLHELSKQGWPIPKTKGDFEQVTDLKQLIRYLRNAISHFNVKFLDNGSNEIRVLRVWNDNPRTGKKTWQAELSVSDLRKLAYMFSDLLIDFRNPDGMLQSAAISREDSDSSDS